LFLRQTFDLGGATETVESGPNQLGNSHTANYFLFTGGKISPTDIFDANTFAHDPKSDFLNWAIIDSGAFDYAADAWGYSYGMVGEWNQDWWTLRAGLFDLSRIPNTTQLERDFSQFEFVGEGEIRHTLFGAPGKVKLMGFLNRGRMGSYGDAVRLGVTTGTVPDTALVRHYASRPGGAINIEQQVTDDLGGFARLSLNDGSKEAYEFTEINRSIALGLSLKGTTWGRPDDSWGVAGVVDDISGSARAYLAAGGLGILIGDGQLRRYGTENIAETYYSFAVTGQIAVSADYQLIVNPAYSRDRGPVSVLGVRLHGQF
jgi:high affinity Mn2+ porin